MTAVAVRADTPWGTWPVLPPSAETNVLAALRSGRWAISSQARSDSAELYEQRFAREFGSYVGAPVSVPTDHGSSALIMALEALQLEPGAHVIVPALTWVATATAVLRAGLVPVVADVSASAGNLTVEAIEAALTTETAAIIVVHWACTMADVPAIVNFAAAQGLGVIEDASQAHGAEWLGRSAGTIADYGCFSLQQAKVLAVGEGGIIVSKHADKGVLLEELRADSRSWKRSVSAEGSSLALEESVGIMGSNFGMNDLAAALACAQLEVLDSQHEIRNANFERIRSELAKLPSVWLPEVSPAQNKLSIYEVPIGFRTERAGGNNARAAEMQSILGVRVYLPRHPLVGSSLLRPWTKRGLLHLTKKFKTLHEGRRFINADSIAASSVVIHHSVLLASEDQITRLIAAIAAVA